MKSSARRSAKPTPTGGQVRDQAKALGRLAFRLVIKQPVGGFVEPAGRTRLRLRQYRSGPLAVDLLEAASPRPTASDLSELCAHFDGRLVLRLQWSEAGDFKLLRFEERRDDWVRWLERLQPRRRRAS